MQNEQPNLTTLMRTTFAVGLKPPMAKGDLPSASTIRLCFGFTQAFVRCFKTRSSGIRPLLSLLVTQRGTKGLERASPESRSSRHQLVPGTTRLHLVAGRVTMLVELKSRFDGDDRLPARVGQILAGYRGPVAPMSFDPRQMVALRRLAPGLTRGIVAAKYRPQPYWDRMPAWMRYGMGHLVTALTARPQFVAYSVADLPALAPLLARHVLSMPLLTWAVRTPAERQRAERWADQMIFEGFRP